jgi:hypothetical protein
MKVSGFANTKRGPMGAVRPSAIIALERCRLKPARALAASTSTTIWPTLCRLAA